MIRFTRSAQLNPAKFMEAITWAKEVAEFMNKKYGIQMTVYINNFGEYGKIHWISDYNDLAAMEKFGKQFLADPEYWTKISRGSDLLMRGSVFDTVMQSL
jgi:hypothetical protein